MNKPTLLRCLSLLLTLATAGGAHAVSVQVRQECGLSFADCGTGGILEVVRGGSTVDYHTDSGLDFLLSYVGSKFVMTATDTVPVIPYGGYGLDIYQGGTPIVRRQSPPCELLGTPGCVPSTSIAFIPWFSFPKDPATPYVVQIAAVPEPATGTLLGLGLGAVLWAGRKRSQPAQRTV